MRLYSYLICLVVYQIYAVGTSRAESKFFKNLKLNQNPYDIHKAILNFESKVHKNVNPKVLYDNVTKNVLNTALSSKIKYKLPTLLSKYQNYAIKKGTAKIASVLKYLSKKLRIEEEQLPFAKHIISVFTKKTYQYFDTIKKEHIEADIDKEFLLLHAAEAFNGLLFDEEINLFNDLVAKTGIIVPKPILMDVMKQFHQELTENKQDDMKYLCVKLNICRPFLGFSDYISDVIHELLKLSDFKLKSFFKNLSIVIDQSKLFQSIFGETVANSIGSKLEENIFRDVSEIRSFIMGLRLFLAKKHIFPQSKDNEANIINKALRILVDIIDKSFDENDMEPHFDLLSKSISKWSMDRKIDESEIQKVLKTFIDISGEMLRNSLTDGVKLEMKALVDVLMKTVNSDNQVYRYIFAYGSKFVKGEDISS